MKLPSIFIALFILFAPYYSHSLDKEIELNINGETHVREHPTTLPEAKDLIDSLVKMYNELDSAFITYQEMTKNEENDLLSKIEILQKNNTLISQELQEVSSNIKEIESYVETESKRPKDWLLLGSLGPSLDIRERMFGLNAEIGILKNLHIINSFAGLNINMDIYNESTTARLRSVGLSIYFGIFLK